MELKVSLSWPKKNGIISYAALKNCRNHIETFQRLIKLYSECFINTCMKN